MIANAVKNVLFTEVITNLAFAGISLGLAALDVEYVSGPLSVVLALGWIALSIAVYRWRTGRI